MQLTWTPDIGKLRLQAENLFDFESLCTLAGGGLEAGLLWDAHRVLSPPFDPPTEATPLIGLLVSVNGQWQRCIALEWTVPALADGQPMSVDQALHQLGRRVLQRHGVAPAQLAGDHAVSRLNITKDQLESALLQWELQHRSGETRTYAETQCMPPEVVAAESASNLWCALGGAL